MKWFALPVCLFLACGTLLPAGVAAEREDTTPGPAAAGSSGSGSEGFGHHGFYFGLGGNWDLHLFEDELQDLTSEQLRLKYTYGANARIGYRLLSWFSTELEYEFLNGFDAEVQSREVLRLKGHAVTGDLKFHIIPVGPVQPNIVIGFGGMKYMISDSLGLGLRRDQWAFASRVGAGLDIYLTKHFLINFAGSAVLTTNDLTNPTTKQSVTGIYYASAQAGFQYRW